MNPVKLILILTAVLFAAPTLGAGMTLEQIARLQSVGEMSLSPDGSMTAFTLNVPRDLQTQNDGPAWQELHLIDRDGKQRAFVSGEVNVRSIAWHPDGNTISFIATRGDDKQAALWGIAVDGGEARRLADAGSGVANYSFSPDGSLLALVAANAEDAELKALREKGFDAEIFEEQWRPRHLWVQALDDDSGRRLLEIEGSVQTVDWSPAGDRLAVRVTPRQLVDDTLMFQSIHILSPQGEELGRIDPPGKLGRLAWSDDGERLALIGTETIEDTREGRLLLADRNGGELRNMLPDLEGHVIDIAWDGDELIYLSHEGVWARIGRFAAGANSPEPILTSETPLTHALEVSAGSIVIRASSPAHPAELYRLNEDGAVRLTDSNPWLAEVDLARQEPIEYPARDGLMIQGLLVWPLDYQQGQHYPLIVAVHGGPESHYSQAWLTSYALPAQHAAAEGYFMFYPNYRGSTGRGVEFALASQGRPAMEEFDDIVDGVDYLIEQGFVDGERVGITGGSYGGYASAWGATYYSERFAAAVMNVGLADKIAMLGTSDIPQELFEVHYRTWPWEDWSLYRQASPIYHVTKAKTPILILHGAADPRVDPTQSRILYRYLSLQDDPPPVRLVLYPGEGHGNRRAASRWDYSLRFMRWMDHYLMGEGGAPPPHELDYGPFSPD